MRMGVGRHASPPMAKWYKNLLLLKTCVNVCIVRRGVCNSRRGREGGRREGEKEGLRR